MEFETVTVKLTASVAKLNEAFRRGNAAMDELAVWFWRGLPWQKKLAHTIRHPRAAWRFWRASRRIDKAG